MALNHVANNSNGMWAHTTADMICDFVPAMENLFETKMWMRISIGIGKGRDKKLISFRLISNTFQLSRSYQMSNIW